MNPVRSLTAAAAVFLIAALLPAAPGLAHMAELKGIQIIHPWAEPAAGETARAYPTIANRRPGKVVLVAMESPVAERVRLYRNGKPVATLTIAGEDIVAFEGTDLAIKLEGLKRPLPEGEHFPFIFVFSTGRFEVDMVVGRNTMMP